MRSALGLMPRIRIYMRTSKTRMEIYIKEELWQFEQLHM